ncbi:MAG: sulfotransferase [Acidobacteriota bacterium]
MKRQRYRQYTAETMGPVVIGGVGGSGTRVVAEITEALGYYLGDDLNSAKDNFWYTLLFKRPHWYRTHRDDKRQISTGLSLLSKLMMSREAPTPTELIFLVRAVVTMSLQGHDQRGSGRGFWPLVRLWRMLSVPKHHGNSYVGWGWKEPNSHLLISDLAAYFSECKYILTIRNGLDMAFSKNQQQLHNWGELYDVEAPASPADVPRVSLKYWVRANRSALEAGRALGRRRFDVVNFDRLCSHPASEIDKMVNFLGVSPDAAILKRVVSLPRTPASQGRYRGRDLRQFDDDDLAELENLGFSI